MDQPAVLAQAGCRHQGGQGVPFRRRRGRDRDTPRAAAGLGGRLGDGTQWLAWIGPDDLLDIYVRAVIDAGLAGPVNAVAPEPVRNAAYTAALAGVLHRPAALPVPALGPRLLLGVQGAGELAEASQHVRPQRLIEAGHQFRFPRLETALRHVLGREPDVPLPARAVAAGPVRDPQG